jgi:hypothetical protein
LKFSTICPIVDTIDLGAVEEIYNSGFQVFNSNPQYDFATKSYLDTSGLPVCLAPEYYDVISQNKMVECLSQECSSFAFYSKAGSITISEKELQSFTKAIEKTWLNMQSSMALRIPTQLNIFLKC